MLPLVMDLGEIQKKCAELKRLGKERRERLAANKDKPDGRQNCEWVSEREYRARLEAKRDAQISSHYEWLAAVNESERGTLKTKPSSWRRRFKRG